MPVIDLTPYLEELRRGPNPVVILVNGERKGARPGPIARRHVVEFRHGVGCDDSGYEVLQLPSGSQSFKPIAEGEEGDVYPGAEFYVYRRD